MVSKIAPAALAVALTAVFAPPAAQADCDRRPGTPDEVKAEPLASAPQSAIRFSWRNTTGRSFDSTHSGYFDISVRDGRGNMVGKDQTGTGPFHEIRYGSRSHRDFTGLAPNQTLCFRIRARSAGGTKGCVSQVFSNQVCATTRATPPVQPKTGTVLKPTGRRGPTITVTRKDGNLFFFSGTGFTPNAPVTIRVTDDGARQEWWATLENRRLTADASGRIALVIPVVCKGRGNLYFSANDGRKSTYDKTGTLWSNTAQTFCA